MRETGSEKPDETKSPESTPSQGSERSYADRMAESQDASPERPPEAGGSAASDGRVEMERPARTERPEPSDGATEAEPPTETEPRAEAEPPASTERSYADRMAESRGAAEPGRMTESDRVEVPVAEAPSESAGQPASRLDRFLARLRPAPEVPQDDAGELDHNQDHGGEIDDDESLAQGQALEHEPALPEGSPPYRDASDRHVHPEVLDVETVRQGQLGDCSLIASIDAMAHRDPARIANLVSIRENGDVVVAAGSGEPMSPSLPNIEEPSERWLNEAGDIYANSTDGSTLGPYIEKAYARDIGGYDKLNEGIWPKDALQYLSGRPAHAERTAGMPEAHLGRVLGPECAAVAHAEERGDKDPLLSLAEQYDVVTDGPHAYAVRGIDAEGRVELHNPWGRQHPLPMSPRVFRQLFPVVSWCEVSKGEHGEG